MISWQVWQLKAIEIGVGRKHKFGLNHFDRDPCPHNHIPQTHLWVHRQAGLGISAMTVQAVTTGNVERENDTLLNALYRLTDLIDDTDDLMTNNRAFSSIRCGPLYMFKSLPHIPQVVTPSTVSCGTTTSVWDGSKPTSSLHLQS